MISLLLRSVVLAGVTAPGAALVAAPACEAAVLYRSGSPAYDEAVNGIRAALTDAPCRVRYVDLADAAAEKSLAGSFASGTKVVATVGIGAYDRMKSESGGLNILPALVLRGDLGPGGSARRAGALYADVPLVVILERLRELFPKKSRVGLIHRPSWPVPDAATRDRIRQMGYELRMVECKGPDKLLAAFSSLKGTVDFVIAEPDTELYNSATVKPLVLASLDSRLPIVGFSASFVRAGALLGVYPDFFEAGRQTGEMMSQFMLGKNSGAEENVRKVKVAVNQQVVRLIGMEPERQEGVEILK